MKTYIFDTSVIIKWYKSYKEDRVEKAHDCLSSYLNNKIRICIPAVAVFEFINIAIYDRSLPASLWQKNIESFFSLNLEIYDANERLAEETFKIGKKYDISSYDASYIALAKMQKFDFITADIKLVKGVNLSYVKAL